VLEGVGPGVLRAGEKAVVMGVEWDGLQAAVIERVEDQGMEWHSPWEQLPDYNGEPWCWLRPWPRIAGPVIGYWTPSSSVWHICPDPGDRQRSVPWYMVEQWAVYEGDPPPWA
jgi:hypothetical protein